MKTNNEFEIGINLKTCSAEVKRSLIAKMVAHELPLITKEYEQLKRSL